MSTTDETIRKDANATVVRIERDGHVVVQAELIEHDRIVELHIDVGERGLPAGTRAALVDKVFDLPQLTNARTLRISLPLGEAELLDRLRQHCPDLVARAAGSTCLIEVEDRARHTDEDRTQ